MTEYKLDVVSWNGISLQTADIEAFLETPDNVLGTYSVNTKDLAQPSGFPSRGSVEFQPKMIPLHVRLLSTDQSKLDALKALFPPGDGEKYLRCTDGANNTIRILAECFGVENTDSPVEFVARLWAREPVWEQDTEQSDTQANITTSPKTWNLMVAGSAKTYPTFEITPTASKDHANGWKRRFRVIVANKVKRTLTDTQGLGYPLDLANDALDTAAEAAAGRLQADGDDLRVLVDGLNISGFKGCDRYLDGVATSTAKVWVSLSLSRGLMATLDGAMTAGSPANGESINCDNPEGLDGWPESGFALFDDEVVYYASRTRTSWDEIVRGVWNTTAAVHSDGITAYWAERDIQMPYDYTAAANPPASDDRKPVIDLASSVNGKHVYGGPFVAPSTLRTGQFVGDYREINELSPVMSMEDTGTALKFVDTPPTAGKPQKVGAVLYVPCGVDTAAASLEQDVTVPSRMLLRAYGSDEGGNEALLQEWNSDTDGVNKQITPSDVLTRLRYAALHRVVSGVEPTLMVNPYAGGGSYAALLNGAINASVTTIPYDTGALPQSGNPFIVKIDNELIMASTASATQMTGCVRGIMGTSAASHLDNAEIDYYVYQFGWIGPYGSEKFGQKFKLDASTKLTGLLVKLWRSPTADGSVTVYIYGDSGDAPGTTRYVGTGIAVSAINSGNSEFGDVLMPLDATLPAGTYWLYFERSTSTGDVLIATGLNNTQFPTYYQLFSATYYDYVSWFHLYGDGSVCQDEVPTNTDAEVVLDNIEITLDTPPYVKVRASEEIYAYSATLENLTTGQSMTIYFISPLNKKLTINCETGEVTGGELGLPVLYAVEWSDEVGRLHLVPGTNNMKYTETGIGTISIVSKWRGRWS